MSLLDQAKKEAKRLFNLANPQHQVYIPNLSASKNIMALINGYQSWHEYESILKRKDFYHDKTDKNTKIQQDKNVLRNKAYYIQDMKFNIINYDKKLKPTIIEKEHQVVALGHSTEHKFFDTKKTWMLADYPAIFVGNTGAGKTEVLLSICKQYLDNKEGVIYMDGKGDAVMYTKIFSYAKTVNRLDDLYCINFLTGSLNQEDITQRKTSHSIDPINPMLGNPDYFKDFFGEEIGQIIYAILENIYKKNQLMDTTSLESILMLNNLIAWHKENKFDNALENYLTKLGLSEDYDDDTLDEALDKHAVFCEKAHQTVKIFKTYSHIFKFNCSVNMENIFLQRKILLVLLPALERSPDELTWLGDLIAAQIAYMDKKFHHHYMQNIVVDEFAYFAKSFTSIKLDTTKNKYLFGAQDFVAKIPDLFEHVMLYCKTHVLMKTHPSDFPAKLKIDIFDHINELPPKVFTNPKKEIYPSRADLLDLLDQDVGKAVILCKNTYRSESKTVINNFNKYYIQYIECVYFSTPYPKMVYLIEHPIDYDYCEIK